MVIWQSPPRYTSDVFAAFLFTTQTEIIPALPCYWHMVTRGGGSVSNLDAGSIEVGGWMRSIAP